MRTLLFLMVNPKGTQRLRLDEEVRRIEQVLERSRYRDEFRLVVKWAVTDDDLRRAVLDHEPEVVHFAGHGQGPDEGGRGRELGDGEEEGASGLVFEGEDGRPQLISGEALGRHFELYSGLIRCVVLNACYSKVQAAAIAQHVDCVIGMKKAIGDAAALKFAVGFYEALLTKRGCSYQFAFRHGCCAIDLRGIPEHLTPVILLRPGAGPVVGPRGAHDPQPAEAKPSGSGVFNAMTPPGQPASSSGIRPAAGPSASSSGIDPPPVASPTPGGNAAVAAPAAEARRATAPKRTTEWDPRVLQRACRDLALYIGPLAKLHVLDAARAARDLDHLYQILARAVPSDEERQGFLRNKPR